MSDKKVYQGQGFLDKVLEATGSADNAFEMAILNGISVTDTVLSGQELKASKVTRKVIVNFFTDKNRPASGLIINETEQTQNEGIDFMAIGNDFIIASET